jgi:O-antigen/teichoic acid export membrane protein
MKTTTLIGYKAASDLGSKLAFFAIVVVAARTLAQDAFGLFSLAVTLGWLLAVATDFGLQLHVAREVARRPAVAGSTLRPLLRVRLALAAGAAFVAAPLSFAIGGAAALPFAAIVAAQLVSSLVEFLNYFYRGLSRSDLESSLNLVQRAATLVLALWALAWRPSLAVLAAALLVPALATLALSARIAYRLGASSSAPGAAAPATVRALARSGLLRDVTPIGAGIVLSALYFRIDLFLVDRWVGVDSVALYNAVFRLVEALRLFPAAVLAVVFPMLCRARTLRPLGYVTAGLLACGAVAAAGTWWPAAWLVRACFGEAYVAAVPAFRVLLVAVPLFFLNYALTHQLIGWDAQARYAQICAAALAVNLACNAVLIPSAGIVGAAWATLVTELVVTGGCVVGLLTAQPRRAAVRVTAPALT